MYNKMDANEIEHGTPTAVSKSKRRSYVTLPLGIRMNRRSLSAGSTSPALLCLLLMTLCLYTFYHYEADPSNALDRLEQTTSAVFMGTIRLGVKMLRRSKRA